MGVLLGGLSSLLFGVGDFLGGEGAKRAPAASIVLWAGVISFPLIAAAALVVGGSASTGDWVFGAAAGAAGGVGLVFLFAGLGRGQAAAVAPAAAALGAMLPVAVSLVAGDRPSSMGWLGVSLAIPAIVLCAWVAEPGDLPFGGLGHGLVAGLGFGSYTVIINQTSAASEILPLITARASTMLVVLAFALIGLWKVTAFRRVPGKIAAASGVLDVAGNIALLLGLRLGSLALVAVAASLYPAVTVAMARVVNHEHLRQRQVVGLLLALLALAAIALG